MSPDSWPGPHITLFPTLMCGVFVCLCGIRSSFLLLPPPLPPTDCHQPIATNEFPPTNCHQPIATNQLPPTNFHQPIATSKFPSTDCHQPTDTHQLSPTNCNQPFVTNQLPPTNCHQPIATTNCHQPTTNFPLLCLVKLLTCGVFRSYSFVFVQRWAASRYELKNCILYA